MSNELKTMLKKLFLAYLKAVLQYLCIVMNKITGS
jgi:hypothetical protein